MGIKIKKVANQTIDFGETHNFLNPTIDENGERSGDFESDYLYLVGNLAKMYGVKTDEIELCSNRSGAIFGLFRFLKPSICYLYAPLSLEFERAALAHQIPLVFINKYEHSFCNFEENSCVVLVNPSDIDGGYIVLLEYFEVWSRAGMTIIIDESFLDFLNEKSAIEFLRCYPKIFIIKSPTKFYADPKTSLSLVISHRIAIEQLRQCEPKGKISWNDLGVLCGIFSDTSFRKVARGVVVNNSILLEKILLRSGLFEKIYPTRTNLLLAKLKMLTAKELQSHLTHYNLHIEECSRYKYLDEKFVRLRVKNQNDLVKLEQGLLAIK